MKLISIIVMFLLSGCTSDFIPQTAKEVELAEKRDTQIPCIRIDSLKYRGYGQKYRDLVRTETLMMHEIETGYQFKQCRVAIDNAYIKYCNEYASILVDNIESQLSGTPWYQTEYIEGACRGNHLKALSRYVKSLKIVDGFIHVEHDNIIINPSQISSIKVSPWGVGDTYLLTIKLSQSDSYTWFFEKEEFANSLRNELLDIIK